MSITPAGVNVRTEISTASSLLPQQQQQQLQGASGGSTSSGNALGSAAQSVQSAALPYQQHQPDAAFRSLVTFSIPSSAEGLLAMAKICELCERWDEMLVCMKRLAKLSALEEEFGSAERELLHVAYRNCVMSRRAAWRVAKSAEQRCELECQMDPGDSGKQSALRVAQEFRVTLENEVTDVCTDLILLVENVMFPAATADEARCFLFKLAADFYRYLAEISPSGTFAASISLYSARAPGGGGGSNQNESHAQTPLSGALMHQLQRSHAGDNNQQQQQPQDEYWVLAQEAYARATEMASSLRPSHPTRLSIALNLSIFYYETMRSPEKALHLARQAFTAAIADDTPAQTILEAEANEAGAILQLLQENLFFWTNPNSSLE